jgi:hypothetical protein
MSLDASGSVAKAITFSKWKGRNYVRQLVKPHNPKTAAQMGVRACMRFLTQAWAAIKATSASSYLAAADAKKISTFDAYISLNLQRWRQGMGITKSATAAETSTAVTITMAAPAGGQRNVEIGLTPSAATHIWGIALYRSTAAIVTANWNNCIAIIPANAANQVTYTDAPLDAGVYHYRAAFVGDDGVIGVACADQTGTAT